MQNIAHVNTTGLLDIIKLAYNTRLTMIVRGIPGIGKSDMFKQFAADRGIGFIDIRALYIAPEDLKFPLIDREKNVVRFTTPAAFPTERNIKMGLMPESGVMVLEEVVSAPPTVQAALYQITLDRYVNGDRIGDGWGIFCTGNCSDHRAVVNRMPTPLVNRMLHVELDFNLDTWSEWALTRGDIEPEVLAYFRNAPEDLCEFIKDKFMEKWIPDTPFCSPRSAEFLSRLLKANNGSLSCSTCVATVGELVGTRFHKFLTLATKLPNLDECIMHPNDAPVPDEPAMCYMVATGLARKATEKNFAQVIKYISRPEFKRMFQMFTVKDAIKINQKLADTKAFVTWSVANKDLITG